MAPKAKGALVKGKPCEQIKGKAGAAEAKKAATMTKEEWQELQKGMKEKWPQPDYILERENDRPHTMYMDKTYEIVTRWTAKTKIEYRPHAKSPGSKSHIRYEKYSKAKTVGQALEKGSWPADWCWDYERGFIKVLGPVRDEPIDIVDVDDEKELTPVDKAINYWYVKELAKKYGFNLKDLYTNAGSGESAIMRAHRLHSLNIAKAALTSAKAEGRRVTNAEVTQCLEAWGYARNPNRQNVNPDGRDWVWSDNMGLTRDRLGSIHITKATTRYPEFVEIITKWLTDRLPDEFKDFKFTSLNLNKNYAAKLHRDGNNFGPSMIAAFGEFTGGELNYWPDDDRQLKLESLKPKSAEKFQIGNGLALFNGNSAHSVNDFEGHRFSVVYFTAGCHAKLVPEDVAILEELGMRYPPADAYEYTLIRKPMGYDSKGVPAAKPKGDDAKKPSCGYWSRATLEKPKFKGKKMAAKELQAWKGRCLKLSQKAFVLRRQWGPGKSDETTPKKRGNDMAAESSKKRRRTSAAGA